MGDFVFTWGSRPISGREAVPGSPPYIKGLGASCLHSDAVWGTRWSSHRPGYSHQVSQVRPCHGRLDVLGLLAHFLQACKVSSGWLDLLITPGFLSFLERVEKTKSPGVSLSWVPGLALLLTQLRSWVSHLAMLGLGLPISKMGMVMVLPTP